MTSISFLPGSQRLAAVRSEGYDTGAVEGLLAHPSFGVDAVPWSSGDPAAASNQNPGHGVFPPVGGIPRQVAQVLVGSVLVGSVTGGEPGDKDRRGSLIRENGSTVWPPACGLSALPVG